MVFYGVGLMSTAASTSRAAAMTTSRLAMACPPSLVTRGLSTIPSRSTLHSFSTSLARTSYTNAVFRSHSVRSLFQPGFQPTISSMMLRSRTFSSSSPFHAASTPPSSPTTPSPSPPPSSSSSPTPKPPLSEDILTVPNLLTMLRLALTPYIGYLVATHQFAPACALLFFASITDLLDGWLARKTGKYTVFGSIADPAADKALVTTMVISLAMSGMLPWTIATIILGRDVALVISAFVIRYRTLEPPKTWSRYFNPKLPSATVTPTTISKYNTFLQLLLLGLLTLYPILFPNQPSPTLSFPSSSSSSSSSAEPESAQTEASTAQHQPLLSTDAKRTIDTAITALMWLTAATTVWSGIGYLGGAGTGKVLAARAQTVSSKVRGLTQPKPKPKPPAQ